MSEQLRKRKEDACCLQEDEENKEFDLLVPRVGDIRNGGL